MKSGIIVDSKTGTQKGELICDIFPRKRGYEVMCVLQKQGKEPTFATHGVYPNKPAAENAIEHVFGAMRSNPIKTFVITIQDMIKLKDRKNYEDFERYYTVNAKTAKSAIKVLRDSGIYKKIIEIREESTNPLVESIISGAGFGIGLFGVKRLFNGNKENPVLKRKHKQIDNYLSVFGNNFEKAFDGAKSDMQLSPTGRQITRWKRIRSEDDLFTYSEIERTEAFNKGIVL